MKGDFSRSSFDPNKPRTSVRMQQGRVLVDADWNEQVDLQERLRRTALRDIVGASGVPASEGASFEVTAPGGALEVNPGRIWVDGLLCDVDAVEIDPAELDGVDAAGEYAVVLEAWDRHLTAIEDPAIREVALGGPDHATRTETVCRVRVVPADAERCEDLGDLDLGDTDGLMAARTLPPVTSDDPCVVPSQAGYTGLENHLYRVEVHRGGSTAGPGPRPTFKWSRDNGSVLSAWLGRSGPNLTIDSLGRDAVRGFHDVEWIELGDDGFDLAGQPGPLVEVEGVVPSEDGEGGILTVTAADAGQLFDPDLAFHPKVRRWDAEPVEINPGNWQPLEQHVEVRFTAGVYRAGDYWWIPARAFVGEHFGSIEWPGAPGAPDDVAQHGVRRARANLAVVRFDGNGFEVLDDCRCVFPTLCRVEGDSCCCTLTVGGRRGDVATIADAIAALPQEGGEICLREGVYRESVTLAQSRVIIRGCGERSVWIGPDPGVPALTVDGASEVTVRDLAFEVHRGAAVWVDGAGNSGAIALRDLVVEARDRSAIVAPSVDGLEISGCDVHYVPAVPRTDGFRLEPALFVGGEGVRLRGNHVHVDDIADQGGLVGGAFTSGAVPGHAPGGVQVVGGSRDVELRSNVIEGGAWHGVVLGSVQTLRDAVDIRVNEWIVSVDGALVGPGVDRVRSFYRERVLDPREFPIREDGGERFLDAEPAGDNSGVLVSDGDLSDVRLIDNEIRRMGGSGVSAAYFFELADQIPDLVGVAGLLLDGNRVRRCLRLRPWREVFFTAPAATFGAVALSQASGLEARDNQLEDNGRSWLRQPLCGAYVQHGRALKFAGNRVVANGSLPVAEVEPDPGRRGGIVVGLATAGTYRARGIGKRHGLMSRQDGVPALVVHDNVVVAPQGRALDVLAFGPVSITDNQLTSQGNLDLGTAFRSAIAGNGLGLDRASGLHLRQRGQATLEDFKNVLGGAAVFVLNLGMSNELYLQMFGFAGFGQAGRLLDPEAAVEGGEAAFVGGNVLFHDNQVVLDGFSEGRNLPLSSIALLTLADLSMEGNQGDCDLPPGELVITHTLAVGFSLRVGENRLTEPLAGAFLSALSFGLMNRTSDNQGTHCFLSLGAKKVSRSGPNEVMLDLFLPLDRSVCDTLQERISGSEDSEPPPPPVAGGVPVPGIFVADDGFTEELAFLPAVADRLRFSGLDRMLESVASERGRAALAWAAASDEAQPAMAERFLAVDRIRVSSLAALHESEAAVVVAENDELLITGTVRAAAGKKPGPEPRWLPEEGDEVVVSKRGDWQNPAARTQVEGDRYALGVAPEVFAEHFKGAKYVVVTLVRDCERIASAEQAVGRLDRPLRRIDVQLTSTLKGHTGKVRRKGGRKAREQR